jgi:predicted nucleic acid-binding protein
MVLTVILIDTSVWIALFRKQEAALGKKMWALVAENQAAVCGQVWVEYIGGFRKEADRRHHERALKVFPFIETSRSSFERAANLLAKYPRLGPGDAIIAATAIQEKVGLFTLDHDFFVLGLEGLKLYE